MKKVYYVGLDTHKESLAIAIAQEAGEAEGGGPMTHGLTARNKAVEGHRTPRRYRVHHRLDNFRQVLECDRPCGAFPETPFYREPRERRGRVEHLRRFFVRLSRSKLLSGVRPHWVCPHVTERQSARPLDEPCSVD